MENAPRLVAAIFFALCPPVTAAADESECRFHSVFAFGDSLTDTGNLCPSVFCPEPPYHPGRWSNGPTWLELAAAPCAEAGPSNAGGPNYAVGGSLSGALLSSQIPAFASDVGGTADPDALYAIWSGTNDGLNDRPAATAASNVRAAVEALEALGARSFLVLNLFDLSLAPTRQGEPAAGAFTDAFNAALAEELSTLHAVDSRVLDVRALFDAIVAHPSEFGVSDVATGCHDRSTGATCEAPEAHLWWDEVHPSAGVHAHIAERVAVALEARAMPVPPSVAPVAAFAIALCARGLLARARPRNRRSESA